MKKAIAKFVDREEAAEQERQLLLERWNRYQERLREFLKSKSPKAAAKAAKRI